MVDSKSMTVGNFIIEEVDPTPGKNTYWLEDKRKHNGTQVNVKEFDTALERLFYREFGNGTGSKKPAQNIELVLESLKEFLLEKNKRYGNSALNPVKVFSKADSGASILIRIDDKISRIKNSSEIRKNDITDLMGYLVLLSVSNGWFDFNELID